MRRKIAAFTSIGVGLALVGVVLGLNLFARTRALDALVGDFTPLVERSSMAQLDGDLARIGRVVDEQEHKMKPMVASALKVTPEQYDAMIAERYPVIDATWRELPKVLPKYQGLVDSLGAQRERFALAGEIPAKDVSPTTLPWAMLAVGALAVAFGAFALRRRGSLAPALLTAMGAAVLVTPLALSFPHKAVEVDALNDSLRPVVNRELVDEGKAAFGSLAAMGEELDTLMSDFGAMFGLTPEQTGPLMAQNFPEFAGLVADFDETTARFDHLIATVEANLGNYDQLRNLSFTPFVWLFLLCGLGMTLSGALAFRLERKLARAIAPVPVPVPAPADAAGP